MTSYMTKHDMLHDELRHDMMNHDMLPVRANVVKGMWHTCE